MFFDMDTKYDKLKDIIGKMNSILVAYSGGVDSTLLLKASLDVLGDRVVAVIATSETYPADEIEQAEKTAIALGARVIKIRTHELDNPSFAINTPERCYYCKRELFAKLKQVAAGAGLKWVAHGANVDDLKDYRPGAKAASEMDIRAPLQEAGLTKADIREISRELGLPTWDKPSLACLASRIPYGVQITAEALQKVDKAETALKGLGFRQVRVRHHDTIARIEVEMEELPKLLDSKIRPKVVEELKKVGYLYVAVDLEGYRTGSMNEALNTKAKTS
ncbi:MAG: ATP-dependent sacrificial sulfur transferase LarE [Armatimonadetes bacterium]|nr:ATP-dependent sacrificial sulfur transferase LarE [Armatimonadota bacterium]